MIIPVKITHMEEPQSVAFRDNTQHKKQDFWLRYDNTLDDGSQESWGTFMTLWDEKITEFIEVYHPKLDDYIRVDITPGYSKREWQGRTIYSRELRVRPVIPTG